MSGRCWCCSTAGAACSATAWCRGASAWRRRPGCNSRPKRCRASSRRSAGTRQGHADRARAHRRPGAVAGGQGRAGSSRCSSVGSGGERRELFHAAGARLGGARRGARPQSVDLGRRQGAPAGECRRDGRCVRRRGLLPRGGGGHGGAPRDRDARRASCNSGRPPPSAGSPADDFAALPVERPHGSSSNTMVVMGERLILKGYRRLRAGTSPELEMGLYLTEVVHFANCAPLAGVLEYVGNDGADAAARAAAGLCRQSGRRLDLLAGISAAASRGAPHGARRRRAARRCARGVSRR